MQLFALIAEPTAENAGRLSIVESFLKEQLNNELVNKYINIYKSFVNQYTKRKSRSNPNKLLAVSSVKLLTICTLLNAELTQRQKIIVLIRLLEFIKIDYEYTAQAYEFISIVAESFDIPKEEFEIINNFIFADKKDFINPERVLLINSQKEAPPKIKKHLYVDYFHNEMYVLLIEPHNVLIFCFDGRNEIYLNQQLLSPNRIYFFSPSAVMRTNKTRPIYHSDIISSFKYDKSKADIVFEVDKLYYKFNNESVGLNTFSFLQKGGGLIGIMGGSGAGKTTLINLLNGNKTPTSGHIYINGFDLNQNKKKLNGYIGYVSQDDMLVEDLTVFENFYFNAKLCFGQQTEYHIKRKTVEYLRELGLYEIKDLKVGSLLNRKISGGQRKRLNIALELIREPSILFLDEPTSGLSSRDSENIMDMLKDLALKGTMVFVVIHQPSSAIFRMFDQLIVMDKGGRMIYTGQPTEAIMYFKSGMRETNWNDSVCQSCGNINPEQIFNIVETRVLNEYGYQTETRKFSPIEWEEKFKRYQQKRQKEDTTAHEDTASAPKELPKIPFTVPKRISQFWIYTKRDILTKLSNLPNVLINLLETPLMALVLSFLIKYWKTENNAAYTLYNNDNLPVYIFMSVIIAVFVGITVSAQEIHRDKKMLQRESFLNLSRGSYLAAKMTNLFILSLYQSFIYVIIGNSIMHINFMNIYYWIILFAIWYSSNIIGLIISDAFSSSASIYIIIPFLVIPQIILSGVLVSFDKLNPNISKNNSIPFFGELITARWAYEALAVKHYKDNPYIKPLYPYNKAISEADYVKNFWIIEMNNKILQYQKYKDKPEHSDKVKNSLNVLRNELSQNYVWNKKELYNFDVNRLKINIVTDSDLKNITIYLKQIERYYILRRNNINRKRNDYIYKMQNDSTDLNIIDKKIKYHNRKLEEMVTNSSDVKLRIIEHKDRLYRTMKPIYYDSEHYFFKAHFYSPTKPFFGYKIDTFWFNTAVLFLFIIGLYVILYYKLFYKFVKIILFIYNKIRNFEEKIIEIPTKKKANKNTNKRTKFSKFIQRYK